jgi:hypothetical protein
MITTRAVPALPPRHRRAARPSRALQHSCPHPPPACGTISLWTEANCSPPSTVTASTPARTHSRVATHRTVLRDFTWSASARRGSTAGRGLPATWPRRSRRRAARGPAPPVKRPETSQHAMHCQTTLGAVIPRDIPPSVTAAPRT